MGAQVKEIHVLMHYQSDKNATMTEVFFIDKMFYTTGSEDYATAHSEFLESEEDENMASTATFSEPTWDNYHQVCRLHCRNIDLMVLGSNHVEDTGKKYDCVILFCRCTHL